MSYEESWEKLSDASDEELEDTLDQLHKSLDYDLTPEARMRVKDAIRAAKSLLNERQSKC